MKKKISVTMITMLSIIVIQLLIPGMSAFSADTAAVAYTDLAELVEYHNDTLEISRLALKESKNALKEMKNNNYAAEAQLKEIQSRILAAEELIAVQEAAKEAAAATGSSFDETALLEARAMVTTLKQAAENIRSTDTEGLVKSIKLMEMQLDDTRDQLISGAQKSFVLGLQMEQNIAVKLSSLSLLEKAVQIAEVRREYGLGTSSSLEESKLQLSSSQAELTSLKHQQQTLLAQLKDFLGMEPEVQLILGNLPKTDTAYREKINLESDSKQAVATSYALQQLYVELDYAVSRNEEDRINIKIRQQEQAVKQDVKERYNGLLESETKLTLAESELSQAAQQLKAAEIQYTMGRLSQVDLESQRSYHAIKQAAWQTAYLSLFWDIENYRALVTG